MEGEGPEAVWTELCRSVLPYRLGNVHRFWPQDGSDAGGALGQLAAAVMNDNLRPESSAVHVEAQVLRWVKELMDSPRVPADFTGLQHGKPGSPSGRPRCRGDWTSTSRACRRSPGGWWPTPPTRCTAR